MKTFAYYTLIYTLYALSASCTHKKAAENIASITISPLKETKLVSNLTPYIDEMQLITIPEEEKTLLAEISKMVIDKQGNLYFIGYTGDKLTAIKPDGSYLSSIANRGQGPMEFNRIEDIALSADEEELMALDGSRILCYNLNDSLKFRSISISTPRPFDALAPAGSGGAYLFSAYPSNNHESNEPLMVRVDRYGKTNKEYLPREDVTFTIDNITQGYNNSYLLRPQSSDHIVYRLSPDSVVAAYHIDFGKKSIPKGYYYKKAGEDIQKYMSAPYYKMPINFFETKDMLYFQAPYGNKAYSYLYLPGSKKGISWTGTNSHEYQSIPKASDGSYFYWLAPAALFSNNEKEVAQKLGALERYIVENFQNKLPPKTAGENPVIVKIKFKKW